MKNIKSVIPQLALVGLLVTALSNAAVKAGDKAPPFELKDINGKTHKLDDYKGTVVLEWYNHECPFVRKHYDSKNMQTLQKTYTGKGVTWLVVNSSAKGTEGHITKPEDKTAALKDVESATALLIDEDGKVGRAYGAKTTPHMYVINKDKKIAYLGAIDDKKSTDVADVKGATNYVTAALDEVLANKPVKTTYKEPYGCGVKYEAKK